MSILVKCPECFRMIHPMGTKTPRLAGHNVGPITARTVTRFFTTEEEMPPGHRHLPAWEDVRWEVDPTYRKHAENNRRLAPCRTCGAWLVLAWGELYPKAE